MVLVTLTVFTFKYEFFVEEEVIMTRVAVGGICGLFAGLVFGARVVYKKANRKRCFFAMLPKRTAYIFATTLIGGALGGFAMFFHPLPQIALGVAAAASLSTKK